MSARVPAILLFTSTLLIAFVYLAAFFLPPTWPLNIALAIGVSGASTSVMAFGLPRRSRRARILMATTLLLTFLLVAAGFAIALRAPTPDARTHLILGLPPAAAAIIYGVGLLPLIVLPIVYALTFDDAREP